MAKTVFSETSIPSSYHGLPITLHIRKGSQTSNTVLVLHPGAFESAWGDNERYKKILLWLQKHLSSRPTVITYETSRKPVSPPNITLSDPLFWQKKESYWQNLFAGKTFDQEIDDVRKVYQYIRKNLHPKQIYVLGFSVGGTIAMILSKEIPLMTKLCLMGSAISTKRPYLPVLTGYPTKQWILKRIANFPHAIKIMQGMWDTVVPRKDAETVFLLLQAASYASFERLAGADHMFSGKNHYGFFAYKTLLPHIKQFFELSF